MSVRSRLMTSYDSPEFVELDVRRNGLSVFLRVGLVLQRCEV